MAKVDFKRVLAASKVAFRNHSPELLTGIGIAGFIATVVLAVKATPEVADSIEFAKENIAYDEYVDECKEYGAIIRPFEEFVRTAYPADLYPVKLPLKEVLALSWKAYLPAAITGVCSTACVIGGISTSLRRTAAMATAAQIAETTLKEYSKKVVEEIGEEKEQRIKEEASKDAVKKVKVEGSTPIVQDGERRLYCDGYTKRLFYATPVEVEHAFGELNREKDLYSEFSMNDFYSCFGLDETPLGHAIGWDSNDDKVGYSISSAVSYDDKAVLVVEFTTWPHVL